MANRFNYDVHLVPLNIKNTSKEDFRNQINNIPYLLYEVETLSDGKKIVINKPGGKRNWGRLSKSDFMVFIYDEMEKELWLITHKELYDDIENKVNSDYELGVQVINCLDAVCSGKEPSDVLNDFSNKSNTGLSLELLLNVYKWIWGQEDVNYPNGQGRWLSMNSIKELL